MSQVSLNCNIVQEICNSTWQGKIWGAYFGRA
jgi:hypothetical protein